MNLENLEKLILKRKRVNSQLEELNQSLSGVKFISCYGDLGRDITAFKTSDNKLVAKASDAIRNVLQERLTELEEEISATLQK